MEPILKTFGFPIDNPIALPVHIQMMGFEICEKTYHIHRKNPNIYVLAYTINGEGSVRCKDTIKTIQKKDLLLLTPSMEHEYRTLPNKNWVMLWFNISSNYLLSEFISAYGLDKNFIYKNYNYGHFFMEAYKIVNMNNLSLEDKHRRIIAIIYKILLYVSNGNEIDYDDPPKSFIHMKRYIDNHIKERITINKLSREFNLSVRQINRIFNKCLGVAPYEYILDKKIKLSCMLLQNTNLSIKNIAIRLSFADEYYFSNIFKVKMGISPAYYRKNNN